MQHIVNFLWGQTCSPLFSQEGSRVFEDRDLAVVIAQSDLTPKVIQRDLPPIERLLVDKRCPSHRNPPRISIVVATGRGLPQVMAGDSLTGPPSAVIRDVVVDPDRPTVWVDRDVCAPGHVDGRAEAFDGGRREVRHVVRCDRGVL